MQTFGINRKWKSTQRLAEKKSTMSNLSSEQGKTETSLSPASKFPVVSQCGL